MATPRKLEGAMAFYRLLREMDSLPEVLRAGFSSPQDETPVGECTTEHGHHQALQLFMANATRCGLTVTDPELASGFAASLVRYLLTELKGYSLGYSGNDEVDALEALAEIERSRLGTPMEANHG